MAYRRRIIDDELDDLFPSLAAVALEGPKAVGKTATATQRAKTILRVDDPAVAQLLRAAPEQVGTMETPILFDEWQHVPELWNVIKRRVDSDTTGGQYLLTGSATSTSMIDLHSGAGRIDLRRMRPLAFSERERETPTVSLAELLKGSAQTSGTTAVRAGDYVEEIIASGFPAIRALTDRARSTQLDSYISRIITHDFPEQGGSRVRRPQSLRNWMRSYAAATATTTTMAQIARASQPGDADIPAAKTITHYRDVLSDLWILDPVEAWSPTNNSFKRLAQAEKHFLADPALAVRLLRLDRRSLLDAQDPVELRGRGGTALGPLFEALVALSLKTYAQADDASLYHFRTPNGNHEIDFIVVGQDGGLVAVEVKLANTIDDDDTRHLRWLKSHVGHDVRDLVVVNTGPFAYRRTDGIAVIPLALLGP